MNKKSKRDEPVILKIVSGRVTAFFKEPRRHTKSGNSKGVLVPDNKIGKIEYLEDLSYPETIAMSEGLRMIYKPFNECAWVSAIEMESNTAQVMSEL